MTSNRARRVGKLALALLLLVSAPSFAQEVVPPEAPQPSGPDPISVADIPSRVERDRAEIDRFAAHASVDEEIRLIADEFPALREELDELSKEPELGEIDRLPLRTIDDLHRRWDQRLEHLALWGGTLHERTESLDGDMQRLSRLEEIWRVTFDAAEALDYPPALIEDIRDLLAGIRGARDSVSDRRDLVAELQADVASERTDIDRIIDALATARDAGLLRLLVRDTVPIWESDDAESIRVSKSFDDTWEMHRVATDGYFRTHPNIRLKFLAVFLLGLAVFARVRKRRDGWELSPRETRAVKMVGDRPVATAAVFALFFGFFGAGRAPLIVLSGWLVVLAILAPIALRRICPRDVWRMAATASLFFVLERVIFAAQFIYADHRIGLIVLFAFSGLITGWLAVPVRHRIDTEGGIFGPALHLVRLQAALLLVASGAVALGWVRLGHVIGGGTLATAMSAWGVYACMKGTEGLLSVGLREWPVGALPSIRNHRENARYQLNILVRLAAFWIWLRAMLRFYSLRTVVSDGFLEFVQREIEVGDITIRPDQIALFFFFALLTVVVAKVLRVFLEEDLLTQIELPQGVRETVALLIWLGCLAGGMFVSFAGLGFDPQSLTVLVGAMGVGLGFGLQDLVKNFAAGIILLIERPVRIGDAVEIGELKGRVRAIGIRSSVIKTYQGAEVIVPNGSMVSREVINWTRTDLERRVDVEITVPHDRVADEVIEVLLAAANTTPGLLEGREPAVIFLGSDATGLRLSLRCWTDDYDNWLEIWSDLTARAHRGLRDAGIPIAIPRRQVASMALYDGNVREPGDSGDEGEETTR